MKVTDPNYLKVLSLLTGEPICGLRQYAAENHAKASSYRVVDVSGRELWGTKADLLNHVLNSEKRFFGLNAYYFAEIKRNSKHLNVLTKEVKKALILNHTAYTVEIVEVLNGKTSI